MIKTDGSYDLSNPQSFNRNTYVQNDPVNFVDPKGLDLKLSMPDWAWEQVPWDRWLDLFEGTFWVKTIFGGVIGGGIGTLVDPPQDPAHPHPHGNEGDLPFNNCVEFVDFLVQEAVASFYDQPINRDSKAKILAVHLMDLSYGAYERHIHNRADGFKRELTETGGQGAGVYGHILFQGGAKLGGLTTNVIGGLADAYDFAQWVSRQYPQAPAEMAGNRAGWAVGQHLYNFLTGKTPSEPQRLRNSLTSELCQ